MRVTVLALGRMKAPYARMGCEVFIKRLSRYFKVQHIELRDVRRGRGKSVEECKEEEARMLRKHLPKGAFVVALDERGEQWTSSGFAKWIQGRQSRAISHLTFVLGGPDGIQPEFLQEADRIWSLGSLTLPHELARVLLFEQLYRAASLMSGHPYHRE